MKGMEPKHFFVYSYDEKKSNLFIKPAGEFISKYGNTNLRRWILKFDNIIQGTPRIIEIFEDDGLD